MESSHKRNENLKKRLRENLIPGLEVEEKEELDVNMFDYPMVNRKILAEEIKQNTRAIMEGRNRADTDSKYIVLETTNESAPIVVGASKTNGIKFYNPMQSSSQFIRNFSKPNRNIEGTMPFHFQERSLAVRSTSPDESGIHIEKFPGTLHLALDSISGYYRKENDNATISLKIEVNETVIVSPIYKPGKNIRLDHYAKIPLKEDGAVFIKATLQVHRPPTLFFAGSSEPVSECNFHLESTDALHNRLFEVAGQWVPIRKTNPLKNMKKLIYNPSAPVGSLKLFVSYISDDEAHSVYSESPESLYSLNKWLTIRKHAQSLLFAGNLQIRFIPKRTDPGQEPSSIMIANEEHVYVKWFGFTIFMFDIRTKKLNGSFTIADADVSCENASEGVFSFDLKNSIVRLKCDTIEKFNGCVEAMSMLFPKADPFVK